MALNKVQEKLLQLENAIKRLDTVKKHLNQNSTDIKAEIHASVSRNLEFLRSREVTLLSQVDQVLRVKEETLQHQQARLNLTLGVLQTGLSMILDQTASENQLTDTLDKLNRVELSPEETPYISFKADHVNLRESILNYGRVDASGLPPLIAFNDPGNPSASLPRHVEEYEDVDHHIFYKTLEEVKRTNAPASSVRGVNISVTIPKLSTRVEDWLQKKVPCSNIKTGVSEALARKLPATRPSLLTKSGDMPSVGVSGTSTPGSSCSLSNWLSLIKQHADLEEEHDFEIFDISRSQRATGGLSGTQGEITAAPVLPIRKDLKNWLSSESGDMSTFSGTFFNHVPADDKFWLAQACQQLTSLEDLKQKDFFQDIPREQSTWLRSRVFVKQQREGYISHDGQDKWLSGLNEWDENKTYKLTDKTGRVGDTNKRSCENSCLKEEWLMRSAASTPSFQLEDLCHTNDMCGNLSKCLSQPDCLRLCSKEKSPVNSPKLSSLTFKHLPADYGWPQEPTSTERLKEGSNLFSHLLDTTDSMWLVKSQSVSISDVSKPSFSPDSFKDGKEETNLWLQKSSCPNLPESMLLDARSPSTSMDFCMSDWLLVPARDNDGSLEDLHHMKESEA